MFHKLLQHAPRLILIAPWKTHMSLKRLRQGHLRNINPNLKWMVTFRSSNCPPDDVVSYVKTNPLNKTDAIVKIDYATITANWAVRFQLTFRRWSPDVTSFFCKPSCRIKISVDVTSNALLTLVTLELSVNNSEACWGKHRKEYRINP